MQYFIGIDGGGTKTDMVLCRADGKIQKRVIETSSNPIDIGLENCLSTLQRGISSLLEQSNQKVEIAALFAGISGGTTGNNRLLIRNGICSFFDEKILINNHSDAISALSSGIGHKNGSVVIAGTGSVGYNRNNGKITQIGGYGYFIDQGGSGYDLGRDALYAMFSHLDGRGKPTLITDLIKNKEPDLQKLLKSVYEKGKRYIASFAPVVFEAYQMNDLIAEKIIQQNVMELVKLFHALGRLSGENYPNIVLAGSVFHSLSILQKFWSPHLQYPFQFILPDLPPVYGSVIEAMSLVGLRETENFKQNFSNSLKEYADELS